MYYYGQIGLKKLTCIISITPLDNPMRQVLLLLSCFLAGDARAQRNLPIIDLLRESDREVNSGPPSWGPPTYFLLSLSRESLVTKQPGVIT